MSGTDVRDFPLASRFPGQDDRAALRRSIDAVPHAEAAGFDWALAVAGRPASLPVVAYAATWLGWSRELIRVL
ncbi:hypothetical protein [Kutzneria sp. CA-103260]|uniref:hypothetical protein n=1 Tax=Kutzneria sp. CA-103260 TaxID=2802641 RepID=UPI001BA7C652|nr:hypothetical protein [Kutzneria sp. CA-103260]